MNARAMYDEENAMDSWLDEDLGSEDLPDPTQEGEITGVSSVVNGFLRNSAGFTREEVGRYVNRAIQNEALDLRGVRSWTQELVLQGDTSGHIETLTSQYDDGRRELAATMTDLRQSRKVLIEPDTAAAIVDLDHDNLMSTEMEVEVASYYGVNPEHDKPFEGSDFQRQVAELGVVTEAAAVKQERPPIPAAQHRGLRHVSEPVNEVMSDLAKRRQRYLDDDSPAPAQDSPGPELG